MQPSAGKETIQSFTSISSLLFGKFFSQLGDPCLCYLLLRVTAQLPTLSASLSYKEKGKYKWQPLHTRVQHSKQLQCPLQHPVSPFRSHHVCWQQTPQLFNQNTPQIRLHSGVGIKGDYNTRRHVKVGGKNENDIELAKYVLFIKACILLEEKVNLMLSITPYRQ